MQDHCRWLYMHICKFSYLKGSIRVTLSWWELKGLLFFFFCISQRLMNIPVHVMCYGASVQVENCTKNITHIVQCTNTDCSAGLPFHQKQITCDWDYRLVKVVLLWYITEFSLFRALSFTLPFVWLNCLSKIQNKEPNFLLPIKYINGCSLCRTKALFIFMCNKCL